DGAERFHNVRDGRLEVRIRLAPGNVVGDRPAPLPLGLVEEVTVELPELGLKGRHGLEWDRHARHHQHEGIDFWIGVTIGITRSETLGKVLDGHRIPPVRACRCFTGVNSTRLPLPNAHTTAPTSPLPPQTPWLSPLPCRRRGTTPARPSALPVRAAAFPPWRC